MEPGSVMTQEKPGEGEPADAKDTQCHQCWHWCEPQTVLLCDTPDTKSQVGQSSSGQRSKEFNLLNAVVE